MPSHNRPNFLITMCDTQPTSFVGAYAGKDMGTPHIDALAKEGTRFDKAYTPCPLCTPARAAFFTGMTPTRAGAFTNSQPLGDTIQTMGQRLTANGYRCAMIGKWHLDGHDYFGDGDCPPGWEGAYWYDGKRYMLDLTPDQRDAWRRGMYTPEDLRANGVTSEFTWAHRITDLGERFLDEQDGKRPWLLVCNYDEPHHPFTCPPEFLEEFGDLEIDLGPSAFDTLEDKPQHHKDWANSHFSVKDPTGKYQSIMLPCNAYTDTQIGRIIKKAKATADATGRPTWIIHTSDHGDHLGTHRMTNKGPSGYEMNTRVPLIIVAPERDGGKIQQSSVNLMDILPTLLELAGIEVPDSIDGVSLAHLVGHEDTDESRVSFTEYTRYEVGHDGFGGLQPLRMLVKGPWKLVLNLFGTDELYNLEEDPDELHNHIEDPAYAEARDMMHDTLITWMYDHIDPWRGAAWESRHWCPDKLCHNPFNGPMRPVPNDGLKPTYLDYDTGKPTRGVAVQYSDD